MKSMTCTQLGGPCELPLSGRTADDVIKAQDAHLRAAVRGGDQTHQAAADDMKGRWRRPISGMGWYRQVKRDFAALPEDALPEDALPEDALHEDAPAPSSA